MALAASLTPHDWQLACSAAEVADGTWSNPGSIARAAQGYILVNPLFQEMEMRLQYDDDGALTVATDVIVQAWGQFADGTWERLADSSGTYLQTLTATTGTDQQDGTYRYTPASSVRTMGASTMLFAIQTKFGVGVGSATSAVYVRGKITRIVV